MLFSQPVLLKHRPSQLLSFQSFIGYGEQVSDLVTACPSGRVGWPLRIGVLPVARGVPTLHMGRKEFSVIIEKEVPSGSVYFSVDNL